MPHLRVVRVETIGDRSAEGREGEFPVTKNPIMYMKKKIESDRLRSIPAKEVSPGLFEGHNCSRCQNGEKSCTSTVPGNCGNPIAKNH